MSFTFFAIQTLYKTGYNKTLFNYLFVSLFILTWKVVTLFKTEANCQLIEASKIKINYNAFLIS